VTVWFPVLVRVAVWVAFCPTLTLAKFMFDGEICTTSCGVGLVFEVFANPAQPLHTAPLHATMANIAVLAQSRRLLAPSSVALLVFAAFTIAI
jgi:hypothetical protein